MILEKLLIVLHKHNQLDKEVHQLELEQLDCRILY